MASVISGDANVSATEFGYLDGVTSALQTQLDSKLPLAGGKILQIVRATDSTQRSTTSTSLVDVTGMSVTITPQKSDSAILVLAVFEIQQIASSGTFNSCLLRLADSSNNALSGAENSRIVLRNYDYTGSPDRTNPVMLLGYVTPATTSAVTYKLQFSNDNRSAVTVYMANHRATGQMYAIEVSA